MTRNRFHGSCHCGNLKVDFDTDKPASEFRVRACQCSFCRKHDARAVSDPEGAMTITVQDADTLQRYRFGTGQIEFLVCRECGVYVAAYTQDGAAAYSNVMVNVLDNRTDFAEPAPVDLDGESASDKRDRHRRNWTPADLRI